MDTATGLPDSIMSAIHKAVLEEFEENSSRICEDDSESSLENHINDLKKFAPRFGVSEKTLNDAVSAIEDPIGEIEEQSSNASPVTFTSSKSSESDKFDDMDLRDLFIPLLDR
ncbi:hypothetical protein [Vibrio navarrensis]|uniref:Uncharacterized protein n=2 Tax=Vibrionaceae TaxID=641 RepID=A0AAJ4LUR8_9VIBR|nr:hypothetical protein I3X05_02985 [Vibrio navarrensis]